MRQGGAALIPVAVLAGHAAFFGRWIVDDAAISFAYATNLAAGHGLVAQAGAAPVEGFSNPLWVLLLALTARMGLFDPTWTPKILSLVLAASAVAAIETGLRRLTPFRGVAPTLAATLIAMQTGVVAWVMSGLENGLYLCELAFLFVVCLASGKEASRRLPVVAGLLASAIALTRPEGVLFLAAYPCAALINRRPAEGPSSVRCVLTYVAAAGVPLLAYGTFRVAYFHAWLPNTYVAKGGPRLAWVLDLLLLQPWSLSRLAGITEFTVGWRFVAWAPLLVLLALVTEPDRSYRRPLGIAATFLIIGAGAFVLLPPDWMPAFRFGTPYFMAFAVVFSLAVVRLIERSAPMHKDGLVVFFASGAVAGSLFLARDHTIACRRNPPIPMEETVQTAQRFERAAELIHVSRPSLLFADVGGPFLTSSLQIIDLGMLCNREIARDLGEGSARRDVGAFHEYVFADRRPTFIATRAYHSWIAALDSDRRFRKDYVPLREYEDQWIKDRYGEVRFSGDYVRRELVSPGVLEKLRGIFKEVRYPGCLACGR